jgi:hypothetical protein
VDVGCHGLDRKEGVAVRGSVASLVLFSAASLLAATGGVWSCGDTGGTGGFAGDAGVGGAPDDGGTGGTGGGAGDAGVGGAPDDGGTGGTGGGAGGSVGGEAIVTVPADNSRVGSTTEIFEFSTVVTVPFAFAEFVAAENPTMRRWERIGYPLMTYATPVPVLRSFRYLAQGSWPIPSQYWLDGATGSQAILRGTYDIGDPAVYLEQSARWQWTSEDWFGCAEQHPDWSFAEVLINCRTGYDIHLMTYDHEPARPAPSHTTSDTTTACDSALRTRHDFTATSVPTGSTLTLYRDGNVVADGIQTGAGSGSVAVNIKHQTVPNQIYEYQFTSVLDGNESDASSVSTVTTPVCEITDFPGAEDRALKVGVYLVRFQDVVPSFTPSISMIAEGVFGDFDKYSATTFFSVITRGALSVSGDVYGDANGDWMVWPVNQLERCPTVYTCMAPEVMGAEVLAFVQSQGVPTENYDAHVIALEGWVGLPGAHAASFPNFALTTGAYFKYPASASRIVMHEAIGHGTFGWGHVGRWTCSDLEFINDVNLYADVGPDLRKLEDGYTGPGGCWVGTSNVDLMSASAGSYFVNTLYLEKIGALAPDEIHQVVHSGSYDVGHLLSSEPVKRLQVDVGSKFSYFFEYRVAPYSTYITNHQVDVHLNPNMASGGDPSEDFLNDVYYIKSLWPFGATSNNFFLDPYRGVKVQLVEADFNKATLQIERYVRPSPIDAP